MKKATLYIDYAQDLFFKSKLGVLLKKGFKKHGYDIGTQSTHPKEESEFAIYIDMPGDMPPDSENSYVILAEPPTIFARNYKREKYKHFKKVFTWHDGLVDGKKIIKLNYPQEAAAVDFNLTRKDKLCALVAKNKNSRRANELFSERLKAVRWFEKHAPKDLDLYGAGWEEGVLERLWFLNIKKPAPKNYRGEMGEKAQELKRYKFSIAYENWLNDCGYITEKIFDCFRASNVPVYLGAKNIEKYIPKECFIDKRDFKTYEELHKYLKNMDDETYLGYLKNIDSFFKSGKMTPFTTETCANTIISEVVK